MYKGTELEAEGSLELGGRGVRERRGSCRALQALLRTLTLTLNEMGSHYVDTESSSFTTYSLTDYCVPGPRATTTNRTHRFPALVKLQLQGGELAHKHRTPSYTKWAELDTGTHR